MPSTITTPISTRMRPSEIDRIRRTACEQDTTTSALLAKWAREGLTRLNAAA
jgi:hypothetical protein